jgi:hypothetical protein
MIEVVEPEEEEEFNFYINLLYNSSLPFRARCVFKYLKLKKLRPFRES